MKYQRIDGQTVDSGAAFVDDATVHREDGGSLKQSSSKIPHRILYYQSISIISSYRRICRLENVKRKRNRPKRRNYFDQCFLLADYCI
jgi:hypothetical protein